MVRKEGLKRVHDVSDDDSGLDVDLTGAVVQVHGTWAKGPGHTDNPAAADAELGRAMFEVIADAVAGFYSNFAGLPEIS